MQVLQVPRNRRLRLSFPEADCAIAKLRHIQFLLVKCLLMVDTRLRS